MVIFHACPYCDNINSSPLQKAGAFSREKCKECRREYWLYQTRFAPLAFNIDEIEVDEESRKIVRMDAEVATEIGAMYAWYRLTFHSYSR